MGPIPSESPAFNHFEPPAFPPKQTDKLTDSHELSKTIERLPLAIRMIVREYIDPLAAIPKLEKDLEILDLRECEEMTDQAIIEIRNHLKQLKKLNLSGCWRLTNAAINHLPPELDTLNLAGCHQIKESYLSANITLSFLCALRKLTLPNGMHLSGQNLAHFKTACVASSIPIFSPSVVDQAEWSDCSNDEMRALRFTKIFRSLIYPNLPPQNLDAGIKD